MAAPAGNESEAKSKIAALADPGLAHKRVRPRIEARPRVRDEDSRTEAPFPREEPFVYS